MAAAAQSAAQASSAPSRSTAASSRATRSAGKNGVSVAMVAIQGHSGRFARAHAIPVSTPASGPAKPATTSGRDRQAEPGEALPDRHWR